MFDYLKPANRPVIDGLEEFEVIYAADQPQYLPLRCLKSRDAEGNVMSRWTLTDEQRKAVADGADLFLTLMTFNQPLQPILLAVGGGRSGNPNPDYFRSAMNLPQNPMTNPATYEDCLEYHDNPSIDKKV